jgi:hypothetical protein
MYRKSFDINKLRVASPCTVGWGNMTGDERQRHCDLCELNVYNISGMTTGEVERLITDREGRLCVRMFRRADGTVITKDCPVGLRAVRKRVATMAGAALTAVLGLFSVSFGQKEKKEDRQPKPKITRTYTTNNYSQISGVVVDPNGAVIPGAKVKIVDPSGKQTIVMTSDVGAFKIPNLVAGIFSLEITSPGFRTLKMSKLALKDGEELSLEVTLQVGTPFEVVGLLASGDDLINTTNPSLITTISSRPLQKLPY